MTLPDSGRYTITNVRFKNFAVLTDANAESDIVSAAVPNEFAGEKWNIMRLKNNKYTIKNHGFSNFASCTNRPDPGANVMGWYQNRTEKQWIIKETRIKDNFTISPTDSTELFWGLPDGEMKTPIVLAETATDNKNWWILASDEDTSNGDSTQESEAGRRGSHVSSHPSPSSESESKSESTNPPLSALRPPNTRYPESEPKSESTNALRPPPYSLPSFDTRPQSPALAPSVTGYTCDACHTDIPAAHPRVHCRICLDYDMCAVCALGERLTGIHMSAHATAIFRTSGGQNQSPVASQAWISHGANSPSRLETRLQSPALAPSATVHTCDACRTHIPAAHPRVHCRICADYNMCAVCTLGERFAGDHTSAHSTAILRISGGRNRPSVNSRTWISYGAGDSGDFVCKLVVRRD